MEWDFRKPEMRWLEENRPTLRQEYPGEWVGIGPEGLLAHAPSMNELLEACSREGHSDPFIYGVPQLDNPEPFIGDTP